MDERKIILDACCGSRMFWFNKNHPNALYVDNRQMSRETIWTSKDGKTTRYCEVMPDIVADFTNLPFADNTFFHVVFDPPHLTCLGDKSWLKKKYGGLPKANDEWKPIIKGGFDECMRVLKPHGTLIFKWSEVDIGLQEILMLIGTQPLYGHRSGKHMTTHWMAFLKDGNT